MKKIELTQNKIALVDDEDYDFLMQYKWYAHKNRSNFYAKSYFNKKVIQMHRILFFNINKNQIDHIDGNGLNNQKSNLRICTQKENLRNRKINKNNTSGYKGVAYNKINKKYIAYISFNKKIYHLGCFSSAKSAAIAYNKAAKIYFNKFAKLNKFI